MTKLDITCRGSEGLLTLEDSTSRSHCYYYVVRMIIVKPQ